MKKCPHCAEEIQDDAIKCKHCKEWIEKPKEVNGERGKPWYKKWWGILIIAVISLYALGLAITFIQGGTERIINDFNSTNKANKISTNKKDKKDVAKIEEEIKEIPNDEYGQEPSNTCRSIDSPGGRGYYKVGRELIKEDDLALAVYNARKYCTSMFGGSNRTFCEVGVDMAIRNMSNLQRCYKQNFNLQVPIQ